MLKNKIKEAIRDVQDFPKLGILFKDITPIFHNQTLCNEIVTAFANNIDERKVDAIIGVESRGFLFGFALARI